MARTASTDAKKTATPLGARLEARLSPLQKGLFQRAADLSGRSLSEFVIASTQDAAERVLREHTMFRLSVDEQSAFVKGLLDDTAPSPRLKKAAKAYKQALGRP